MAGDRATDPRGVSASTPLLTSGCRAVGPVGKTVAMDNVVELEYLDGGIALVTLTNGKVNALSGAVVARIGEIAAELTAMQAAPLVAAMRERAEEVRRAEFERFTGRLDGLDDEQRAAVEALTRGIVNKLLHEPSVRLRAQAGTPQGERNAAAVADLFDIE